jgi:anti-sigma regulatory factor (Ser/Thr protein kinase)
VVQATLEVAGDLAELAPMRTAVVGLVPAWGAAVDRSVLELLVSEVLANAMEHGAPPITVLTRWDGNGLRVAVGDASPDVPVHREPSLADAEGRGVWLVDRHASAWGVDCHEGGKTVWFELR